MFQKRVLKVVAYVVLVAYFAVFPAGSVFAAEGRFAVNPRLFAQAAAGTNPTAFSNAAPEEENAMRQIYNEKIRRLEAEMNSATGTRDTLLTVAVSSLFIGGGVMAGGGIVKSALDDISTTGANDQNQEDALKALDAVTAIGGGVIGIGGLSLAGYLIYTGMINGKQNKIDTLRGELDQRFAPEGLTPEYLQKNESVAAVIEEINAAKKSAGTARTLNGFFSRVGMGSLLSGGFLFALSKLGRDVIERADVAPADEPKRSDALDKADQIGTTGIILLAVGGVCEIASFFFGRRASSKATEIENLENSLLRVASRFDLQPTPDGGLRLMYTYKF